MERPVGGPGASERASVLDDDDAFEDDSVDAGETHSSASYPGHDTMQDKALGGQQERPMASATTAAAATVKTPGFVRVAGEWVDEHYEADSVTEGTHAEALPFTAESALAAAATLTRGLLACRCSSKGR